MKLWNASGIIISALGHAALRIDLDAEENLGGMIQLFDSRYAFSRKVCIIAVATRLFKISYRDQNKTSYIDQYTSLCSQLQRFGSDTAIVESLKPPFLLASVDPMCCLKQAAAGVPTREHQGLSSDYVTTTTIDEFNARRLFPNIPESDQGCEEKEKLGRRTRRSIQNQNISYNVYTVHLSEKED